MVPRPTYRKCIFDTYSGVTTKNQYPGAQLQYIFLHLTFIVLKFLIFDQVVRPQFWSHDKTNTQVHNFNIYSFIVDSFILFCPVVVEFGRGITKLQIVLKFLIFDQVVRPQFRSHDKTNTQVHNFNIYSFIVESLIRFCPVVLEFGSGIENLKN